MANVGRNMQFLSFFNKISIKHIELCYWLQLPYLLITKHNGGRTIQNYTMRCSPKSTCLVEMAGFVYVTIKELLFRISGRLHPNLMVFHCFVYSLFGNDRKSRSDEPYCFIVTRIWFSFRSWKRPFWLFYSSHVKQIWQGIFSYRPAFFHFSSNLS